MTTRRKALMALPFLGGAPRLGAQAPKSLPAKRIGMLVLSNPRNLTALDRLFWLTMNKKGWLVDVNVVVERVYANWNVERLAVLARELVLEGVDLILTAGPEATLAAARATRTIPIVFSGVLWPIEQGLIDSLARPGRNLTGHTYFAGVEVILKRLEFLREIIPAATRLSWLWPEDYFLPETVSGAHLDKAPAMKAASSALGFEAKFHTIRTPDDIAEVFREITGWRAQAVTAGGGQVFDARQRFAELALMHRLPSVFSARLNVEAGGLLFYGVPDAEYSTLTIRAAENVDAILRGATPAEIAVEQPSRYELVINKATAKALGLTIPRPLLLRADDVIE
ncbi:MAG: ABC transporter substrate-binding protein [Burkholderiaceae bacterium]